MNLECWGAALLGINGAALDCFALPESLRTRQNQEGSEAAVKHVSLSESAPVGERNTPAGARLRARQEFESQQNSRT
jgi:hypothetical protein